MLDGHRSCTPVNSHPVTMPWSSSSSLHHHPVINFSENSLRQGPLIYYVYIPARVYRNFDKENFKNISLLKSLKRELFSLKSQLELSWFSNPTNFPSSFLVASSLCLFQTLLILFRRLPGTREQQQQRIVRNIEKKIFFNFCCQLIL